MFSLFVSHLAAEQGAGAFTIDRNRFLENTEDRYIAPLRGLSNEAKECLRSWPCVLMPEGRAEETVRIVEIVDITASTHEVTANFRALPGPVELTANALWKLRIELDLEQFEFSRNHWAVKDRNLFEVLRDAGVTFSPEARTRFVEKGLPIVRRAELLRTRDALAILSNAQIDDLLLEAGVAELEAGRVLGTRRNRADAVIQFVLANPAAVTAENSLFSHFLLSRLSVAPAAEAVAPPRTDALRATATEPRSPNRVFVVHGHNEQARIEVTTFLASMGLVGIVLHDQPNMGRHLLTKFINEAELVTFAVVLMTDDDAGCTKGGTLAPRARQNVILELGYFLAHLGQSRVCALISPGLETPSDFDGIVYIRMDRDHRWKGELLRELVAANMPVTSYPQRAGSE